MQDVKAPAGEWRIGNFFVANDKLEAAVHADCPALNDGRNLRGGAIQFRRMVDDNDMGIVDQRRKQLAKPFAASVGFWRIAEQHEAATARLVLADGRRWSGQMQQALSGTEQWRSGLQHNHVRESNSLAGGKIALCRPKSQHTRRV
ncbi:MULTISPECIES: hypothetical protein [unclassified Mesorhizobium]|uniref:hypothetical protein n=1 Tax=unclassified Mesorhizobium TaxID=325217 RepID=UPI0016739D7C|nr:MULTISPECIES: hypothetical protein [unclassified Mesorhizobium]